VGIQGALADAHALLGNADTARALYETARDQAPGYAHDLRARLLLRFTTAQHPKVVRVLTSRDSAVVQARHLAALRPQSAVVRAWRAVRWMDANRYSRALAIWRQLESPIPADRPREWRRTWALQRTAWGTTAALRVGSTAVARRWADRGRDRSRRLGDKRRAAVFAWWERRAEVPGATRGEASSSLTRPNHASGLLVQEARMPYEGPSRRGACASF
jgi:hypothetical protein